VIRKKEPEERSDEDDSGEQRLAPPTNRLRRLTPPKGESDPQGDVPS
jgi:hypothetical protein